MYISIKATGVKAEHDLHFFTDLFTILWETSSVIVILVHSMVCEQCENINKVRKCE